MHKGVLILLAFWVSSNPVLDKAEEAYLLKKYSVSIKLFSDAQSLYPEWKPQLKYNLATAWLMADTLDRSSEAYGSILKTLPVEAGAKARNNLGYIAVKQEHPEEALEYWKAALRLDPNQEKARYNYELLKKRLKTPPPPPPDEENSPESDNPPPPPKAHPRPPKPTESQGNVNTILALSEDQTLQYIHKLGSKPYVYIQQLKKSTKSRLGRTGNPDW